MSTDQNVLWAVVELMGHQRIAGRISDHPLGGETFLRVDVPAVGDAPAFTKLFGGKAVYAISFVDEAIATAVAKQLRARPVDSYQMSDAIRQALADKRIVHGGTTHGLLHDDDEFPG
jgi:hypothetical protein